MSTQTRNTAKPVSERSRNARSSTSKRSSTKTKRAAIYGRYSVERDGKLSDAKQVADGKAKAAAKGFDVVGIYVDKGKSAGEGKRRPEWDRLLDDCAAGRIDVVIVAKLDRFTRSTTDFAAAWQLLQANDVELISIAEDFDTTLAIGRAMQQIVVTFAELERSFIVDRNAGIAKYRRDNGMVGGLAPYGYVKTGKGADARFEIDEAHAAVVRGIVERIIDGQSLRSIAKHLNETGAPIARHARRSDWSYTTVRQVATSPAIAGWRENPETPDHYLPAPWDAIVDDETWRIMLAALSSSTLRKHSSTTGRRGETPVANLLSGILICGRCGTPMGPMRQPNGKLRYRCNRSTNPNACLGLSVLAEDAEQHVIARLLDELSADGHKVKPVVLRDSTVERVNEISEELDELERLYELRKINLSELMRWRDRAQAERAEIEAQIGSERRDSQIVKLLAGGADYRDVWASGKLTIETKRAIIREAFASITCVDNGRKGLRVPIAERIAIVSQSEVEGAA